MRLGNVSFDLNFKDKAFKITKNFSDGSIEYVNLTSEDVFNLVILICNQIGYDKLILHLYNEFRGLNIKEHDAVNKRFVDF